MASVQLKNVCKKYPNGYEAVKDFNLDIQDKEFIIFVGPSGCGKSTTLRMVAGLEDITSGELIIDGKLMNDVEPKDRDIAMVFQSYALYPHMTVYDNMAFSLKLRKMPKDQIDKAVREAAGDAAEGGIEYGGVLALYEAHGAYLAGNRHVDVLAHDLAAERREL